jgi:hypothetical protein
VKCIFILSLALAFAGCAEREQTANGIPSDAAPFSGTDKQTPFMTEGWKPGERGAWEQHLRVRTQHQNEYAKVQ